jgi:peptidoglycan/LPS O-acetylase OafA/YrhL
LSDSTAFWEQHGLPAAAATLLAAVGSAGRFGVNLFFLLSAYLITSLLVREKSVAGEVGLRSFYLRRILRIWPLYFFALLVASIWPVAADRMPLVYLCGYLLLAGNWMTAILGAPPTFMSVLWSVSIEEQFYLSWPLAMKRLSRPVLIAIGFALLATANGTRIYLSQTHITVHSVWPNTFAQLDTIGVGILCALLLRADVPKFMPIQRCLLVCSGAALLLICGHYYDMTPAFTILGYCGITLGCLALFLGFAGARFRSGPLVYLGKISYGLYVYHRMCQYLMGYAFKGHVRTAAGFAIYSCGALALTIALGAASYRWLETPFLRLKDRFAVVHSRPV